MASRCDRTAPSLADRQGCAAGLQIDWTYVGIVAAILVIAITANVVADLKFPAVLDVVPVIGLAVWIVVLDRAAAPPDWKIMPETFKGTIFLLALVTNARSCRSRNCRPPRG